MPEPWKSSGRSSTPRTAPKGANASAVRSATSSSIVRAMARTMTDRPAAGKPSSDRVGCMRRPPAADLMLLLTVAIWGFNFTVTKYLITHGFKPLSYSAVRYGAGALIFAAFTAYREGSIAVTRRDGLVIAG